MRDPLERPRELDPDPELPDPELLVRDREPAPELLLRELELLLRDFEPELPLDRDFEPELPLDCDFEPELPLEPEPELCCLLSLSSAKIKLLGLVCRGPCLALGQALHQPLLLPLTLLG